MSDQKAEKPTPTDSAGVKGKDTNNDAGANNRDTSLVPAKDAAKGQPGKGADTVDLAARAVKGYVEKTGETVKDAVLSPASPLGALVHGVQAVAHVVRADNKVEAIKQEARAEAKVLHEALPGTAAREAGYAGLNDLQKGATAEQAGVKATEAALKHAPFVRTVDHLEKAEAARAKGDSKTAADEYGKAVASYTNEVVQTTLALEGTARAGQGPRPVAGEVPAGKGRTQPLPAAAEGGKGNTQRIPGATEGGTGSTQRLEGGAGNTQRLPGPGGDVSPMATTISPMAKTQAPGHEAPRQVRIDAGGEPHARTQVAGPREGQVHAPDRPSLNDTQRLPAAGSDPTLRLSTVDLAGKQIIDLQRNGTAYQPDGRPTPQMEAAMKVIEDHVNRTFSDRGPQR